MKKKVLYVITKGTWGGAQRYVYDLSTALKDEYDVAVAIGGGGLLASKLKQRHVRTIIVPTLERDITWYGDVVAFFDLLKIFRAEKPDIVHLNSSKAGALGAVAARLAGVRRVIFTVHGWSFNEPVPKTTKIFRWIIALITILLCHRSISVSYFGALQAPLGIDLTVIHNGLDEHDFLPRAEARAEIMKRTSLPPDAFVIGSIAELHMNKGIDILIQATYLVDDIHVVVIGEGEERTTLEKLITDLGLENRVHLIGFIDHAARYLKAFDTFALPSRTEILGYVLLEAGLAEVPVIASAVGGIPEVISDQLTGDLVHAFNDEKLAESMTEFRDMPNTRARYAEALKARVERYFNFRGMIKKTLEVYRS